MLDLLLERGSPADEPDAEGCSALHLAVQGQNAHVVRLLLDKGATVDRRDKSGKYKT